VRADAGVLFLRLAGLGLAIGHGLPKVLGLLLGTSRFPDSVAALGFPAPYVFAWAAALCELLGGLGVTLGLFTRVSAFAAAVPLLIAAFVRHRAFDRLLVLLNLRTETEETLKSWGSPELALVYLLPIIGVALIGPGRLSIDAMRSGPRVGGKR
jgi:putative oxidoreductase